MDPRPGRARGQRVRAVTRARLLEAAEEVFFATGYGATSIDTIAAVAGYTTGAIYSNFGGKADLFLAVLERASERDVAAMRSYVEQTVTDEQVLGVLTASAASDRDRWRARVAATFEFVAACRAAPELHQRVAEAQQVADEALGELLVAIGRRMGLPRPADLPGLARAINSMLGGYGARAIFDERADLAEEMSRNVVAMLIGASAATEFDEDRAHV